MLSGSRVGGFLSSLAGLSAPVGVPVIDLDFTRSFEFSVAYREFFKSSRFDLFLAI